MELLVCGMHRSGTSAVAHLLSEASGRSLLEDPDWAMTGDLIDPRAHAEELAEYAMLKCPRMTEVLPEALAAFPGPKAAVLVRDPRDVLCSILEKVKAGMPTRMLEFTRLGVRSTGSEAFGEAYTIYAATIDEALERHTAERVRLVIYERFCEDKPGTVADLARWLGWACDPAGIAARQDRQLGPAHTKHASDQSIKGPRRWARELDERDARAIAPAVDAYEALTARA